MATTIAGVPVPLAAGTTLNLIWSGSAASTSANVFGRSTADATGWTFNARWAPIACTWRVVDRTTAGTGAAMWSEWIGATQQAFVGQANIAAATVGYWSYPDGQIIPASARSRLASILTSRRAPAVHSAARPLGHADDAREVRARETLRRVVGEEKYRNFLRTGWVSVRARSGLIYRIFPGHGLTEVYDRGRMKERLCVVLDGGFPATDTVIVKYLLVLNNEQLFRSKANVAGPVTSPRTAAPDFRPIIEIAREIRGGQAFVLGATG